MGMLSIVIAFGIRLMLVLLFLPFSALDKLLEFNNAVGQAKQAVNSLPLARGLIVIGFCVELFMSAAILTGVADRAGAFILAGYCVVTALLWKQFWRPGDFWSRGDSKARGLFWDFWKNVALAGGFLLISFGTTAATVGQFFAAPLGSSQPYAVVQANTP
jgi:putative oxidoreductase